VGAVEDDGIGGDFVNAIDEDDAAFLEAFDHVEL